MADNKEEKLEEATAETEETKPAEEKQEATEETAETASADEKSEAKEEGGDDSEETSIVEDVVSAVASTVETVAETVAEGATALVDAVTGNDDESDKSSGGKRNEKVGVVYSDKMQKTVVVRVDRTVKHPLYHKYMKRRKKFMAHDELGATEGDRVRIVETRPMSARKRWRVVEIIQKAEK